jgi:UDP-N-acetylglucosamine:LPS N-acetylglucosamine transferase
MAAALLRRLYLLNPHVFIHEQNAVPGKLNQLMAVSFLLVLEGRKIYK